MIKLMSNMERRDIARILSFDFSFPKRIGRKSKVYLALVMYTFRQWFLSRKADFMDKEFTVNAAVYVSWVR